MPVQSIPIIIGGSVLFGALLGMLLLAEKLQIQGWAGIGLLVLGIGLVATDPGDKVEEGGGSDDSESKEPSLIVWIGMLKLLGYYPVVSLCLSLRTVLFQHHRL